MKMKKTKKTIISITLTSITLIMISLSVFVSAYQLSGEEDNVVFEKSVEKGWNLLGGGVFASNPAPDSDIKKEDVLAVYFYDNVNKKYIMMHPDGNEKEFQAFASLVQDPAGELGSAAAWVYVKRSGMIKYTTDDFRKVNSRQLRQGWNFVTIDNSFGGHSVAEIKGDCDITKYARWGWNPATSYEGNQWIVSKLIEEINKLQYPQGGSYVGEGNLLYVTNNCKLGLVSIGTGGIPQLPN